MLDERNLMRAWHVHDVWESRDRRLHDVELAEHRRGEHVYSRVVLEEELRDIAPPHVRRAAQRRLEIAITPIDRAIDQRLVCRQHLLHRFEIEMARDHEPFHPRSIDLRIVFRKIRHVLRRRNWRGGAYTRLCEHSTA